MVKHVYRHEYFSAFDRPLTAWHFSSKDFVGASTLPISIQGSRISGVHDCMILDGSVGSLQRYKDAEMESSFGNDDSGVAFSALLLPDSSSGNDAVVSDSSLIGSTSSLML